MFLLKRARVVQSSGTNLKIYTIFSPPVCCEVPRYGQHESSIVMDHIGDLLKNDVIEECKGPWGGKLYSQQKLTNTIYKKMKILFGACVYHIMALIYSLYLSSIQYRDVITPYQLLQWAHL